LPSGDGTGEKQMKPKLSYSAVFGSEWDKAFAKVQALGEGAKLGDYVIHWIHTSPDWVQLRGKDGRRMVRRDDPLLVELTR
jgi:hypothetical protein